MSVDQVMCLCILLAAVVMSGDVGCWCMFGGSLVGVFSFSMMCSEFCMRSEMRVPLWSSVGECHELECAFMSPVMMVFGRVVRYVKHVVMSWSSVGWLGSAVSRGGMYRFATCIVL